MRKIEFPMIRFVSVESQDDDQRLERVYERIFSLAFNRIMSDNSAIKYRDSQGN